MNNSPALPHIVKVTPEQRRRLLELQDTWRSQPLIIINGVHPMTAAEYISAAQAICPDMREGSENIFELIETEPTKTK